MSPPMRGQTGDDHFKLTLSKHLKISIHSGDRTLGATLGLEERGLELHAIIPQQILK